jgi:hypothetical protein
VPDVTKSFTVTLPGIVHRYDTGHFGNKGIKPVTVVSDEDELHLLQLPTVG